jgi:hypothetical protein
VGNNGRSIEKKNRDNAGKKDQRQAPRNGTSTSHQQTGASKPRSKQEKPRPTVIPANKTRPAATNVAQVAVNKQPQQR